jgi:hypothetical protein
MGGASPDFPLMDLEVTNQMLIAVILSIEYQPFLGKLQLVQ